MQKINLLSPRLKTVFIDIGKRREVSLYDYYKEKPDEAAKDIQKEIVFDGTYWKVSDKGCLFNYFDYIKYMGSAYIQLVGYNDGLVFECK